MKKINIFSKILCLILVFSLLFAMVNSVLADHWDIFIPPRFEIAITDVAEPIIGEKPSFDNEYTYESETGHEIVHLDLAYWFEFDEDYEDVLDDMDYVDNFNEMEGLFIQASKYTYNSNADVETYPISKLSKFQGNKTYMAVFFATYYEKHMPDNEKGKFSQGPVVETSVNGETSNVKSLVYEEVKKSYTAAINWIAIMAIYEPREAVLPTSDIKATVNWNDADGNIPESLILKLMNGSTVVKQQTVTKANAVDSDTWEYDFGELPTIDDNGNEINYTLAYEEVNEGDLKYFETTVNGFTIDNTYVAPEVTSKVKMRSIVDRDDNNVKYKIDYSASIKKYSGDANIEIKTTLPFAINEEKSDLDGGTYDAKTRSITWTEKIEDIDNKYDYSTTKNVNLYATAVLPYSIEATTVGEIKLANAEDFSDTVDTVDIIESSTGNPKTGDNNLVKYLSLGLIGIVAILMVISIKRKYSTRKSNVQF